MSNVEESQWSWYSYINPFNVTYLFYADDPTIDTIALARNAPIEAQLLKLKSPVTNMGLLSTRVQLRPIATSLPEIQQARANLRHVITNSHRPPRYAPFEKGSIFDQIENEINKRFASINDLSEE
jgi:hypothetical protein